MARLIAGSGLLLLVIGIQSAPATPPPPPAPPGNLPQPAIANKLSPADLQELLGPIALYPDPLLANVLTACVYPGDIAKASAYVKGGGDPNLIEQQGWEPSVQAIAKIPDVLKMLADSPDWAAAVGEAYLVQAQDVMAAVQSLRAKAQANGALKSNDQQTIVKDGSTILIQPAQPQVVYVPQYNPQAVYAAPPSGPSDAALITTGLLSFGTGIAVGSLFNHVDCDWHHGGVCYGGGSYYGGDGHYGGGNVNTSVNRNTNVNQNINRTNVNVNNYNARAGPAGTAWKPNADKVRQAQRNGQLSPAKLNEFRGAGSSNQAAMNKIPGRNQGAITNRNPQQSGTVRNVPKLSNQPVTPGQGQAQRPQGQTQGQAHRPQRQLPKPQGQVPRPQQGPNAAKERGSASRNNSGGTKKANNAPSRDGKAGKESKGGNGGKGANGRKQGG